METRVKERLVGAVILVALIVALVPEILSGPRETTDAGSPADSEQPLRTYTIELEQPDLPAVETAATSTPGLESTAAQTDAAVDAEVVPEAPPATIPEEPEPATQARPEPQVADPAPTAGWAVQVGSFSNVENAERMARELRARGFKAFVSSHESQGEKLMRVRVGPEKDRARAEQLAKRLRRDWKQATVVAHP